MKIDVNDYEKYEYTSNYVKTSKKNNKNKWK